MHTLSLLGGSAGLATVRTALAGPSIAGINAHAQTLSEGEWPVVLRDLRARALLAPEKEDAPDRLEVHPIIASYFGQRMRTTAAAAWAEANRRLSEFYIAQTSDAPLSLAEAGTALKAVFHLATAGILAVPLITRTYLKIA